MAALNKLYIYRMTHIENIPHVLQNGITHIASSNSNKAYVPIGDGSLIQTRQNFITPFGTKLGEYIPFYFGCRMPMLYVVQNGFNGVTATNPENIVYCISSVQKVIDLNLDWVFTNGHAVNALSNFYDISQAPQIETLLDFVAIRAKWWNEDLDMKRRKEAEFLINNDVPSEAIIGYVVYNESAQKRLIDLGIAAEKIVIKPNCYF